MNTNEPTRVPPTRTEARITGLTAKIGTLERRMEHLQRRLDQRSVDYGQTASADFDRSEIAAIKAAIECMRTHQGAIGALGVVYWRGSGTDLATDIKALVPDDEIKRLKGAL